MTRRDALPEGTEYRDDGCQYAPRCLECPWSTCVRYDLGPSGNIVAYFNSPRDETIRELRQAGMGIDDLTRRFGVSKRTVYRVLSG